MAQQANDPRFERFAHWPARYQERDHGWTIRYGIFAFERFFEDDGPTGFEASDFARGVRSRLGVEDATLGLHCLLDFVLVWLVEGDAALVCPSFESYLLVIVGLIEQQRFETSDSVGSNALLRAPSGADTGVDIFYWATAHVLADEEPRNSGSTEETVRPESSAGTRGVDGYSHPALSRDVYDLRRSRLSDTDADGAAQRFHYFRRTSSQP